MLLGSDPMPFDSNKSSKKIKKIKKPSWLRERRNKKLLRIKNLYEAGSCSMSHPAEGRLLHNICLMASHCLTTPRNCPKGNMKSKDVSMLG